jgi:flagellar biosynthetic protein FliP
MAPVFDAAYTTAYQPYEAEQIGGEEALNRLKAPFHKFMMAQTREDDIGLFSRIANQEPYATPEEVPFTVLMPAFLTSELKTAFQIGFMLFIPFLIIDLVVASVLMAMGMMMLSPLIISLPFKLMLFVLVDGWALVMGTLASSFAPM